MPCRVEPDVAATGGANQEVSSQYKQHAPMKGLQACSLVVTRQVAAALTTSQDQQGITSEEAAASLYVVQPKVLHDDAKAELHRATGHCLKPIAVLRAMHHLLHDQLGVASAAPGSPLLLLAALHVSMSSFR